MLPSVTIITPTTFDRAEFNANVKEFALMQDYQGEIQHLFDYSLYSIGEKRNILCAMAMGDVIVHMDSDDYYAPDWVSKSVEALKSCDVTGLKSCFFDRNGDKYRYDNTGSQPYIIGATLCYRRKVWERVNFKHIQVGEDNQFLIDTMTAGFKIKSHEHIDSFCAYRHGRNTSPVNLKDHCYTRL